MWRAECPLSSDDRKSVNVGGVASDATVGSKLTKVLALPSSRINYLKKVAPKRGTVQRNNSRQNSNLKECSVTSPRIQKRPEAVKMNCKPVDLDQLPAIKDGESKEDCT